MKKDKRKQRKPKTIPVKKEPGHQKRFDDLLTDAIFGAPKKKS